MTSSPIKAKNADTLKSSAETLFGMCAYLLKKSLCYDNIGSVKGGKVFIAGASEHDLKIVQLAGCKPGFTI